jgi:hypothetical protein
VRSGVQLGRDRCSRKLFSALYTINADKVITLIFTQPLQNDLTQDCIEVSINDILKNYKIKSSNPENYEIYIELPASPSPDQKGYTFCKAYNIQYNALLYNKILEIIFYTPDEFFTSDKIQDTKQKATDGITIGLSVVLDVFL